MFEPRFAELSLGSIRRRINALKTIDLKQATLDELRERLSPLLLGFLHVNMGFYRHQLEVLYRIRKIPDEQRTIIPNTTTGYWKPFDNITKLWYPPPERIHRLGRLNNVGTSLFYASDEEKTPLFEVRPAVGDVLVLLTCRLKSTSSDPPRLIEFGLEQNPSWSRFANDALNIIRGELSREDFAKYQLIRSFLIDEFTRPVRAGNEHEYKLSLLIAEHLLRNPDCGGIMYPSIATFAAGINIALKPDAADAFYEPLECKAVSIVKSTDREIDYATEAKSIEILPDGRIVWEKVDS